MSRHSEPRIDASLDPSVTEQIITHMNADHADAVLLYVQAFAHIENATAVRMVSIDLLAMTLEYDSPEGTGTARIVFDPPLTAPQEVRARLIVLVNEARRVLGVESETSR